MATDNRGTYQRTARDPGDHAVAVTPSDSTDLDNTADFLWVGVAGDVSLITQQGYTVTFKNVQGLLPIRTNRVRETDTTATDIVAVWS